MRIALIQLPQRDVESSIPLGILAQASFIQQYHHQPTIIDLDILFKKSNSSTIFFKKAAKRILKRRPSVIGFSVMCTTLAAALLVAKECKKITPKIPIIFGGPEVSFEEAEALKAFKQVDLIVRGEGEITLVEVLNALEKRSSLSNILGITYRRNGDIVKTPDRPFIKDLDQLPLSDFSLLPHLKKYDTAQMEAGRGCPFRCAFCSTCRMWKRAFRMKSPQRILKEVRQIKAAYKDRRDFEVSITHDNFLAHRKSIDRSLSLISQEKIIWSCSSRLEPLLEGSLVKKLRKAGCKGIFIGVESGSPEMQKKIKKGLPLSRLQQAVKMLIQNDIQPTLSFILGFPGENEKQIDQTLEMALMSKLYSVPPNIQIHPFTFLKGSELHSKYKKELKKAKFWQTDISPLNTGSAAEIDLIKKHPSVFPSFYCLKRKNPSTKFLEKACILFFFLTDFLPLTTLSLQRHFSCTLLDLGRKMISFLDKSGAKWIIFQETKDNLNYYGPFIKKFIKNLDQMTKEVLVHEELFLRSSFIKTRPIPAREAKLSSRPKIARGVKIKAYNYDIIDLIRAKHKKKVAKKICYMAYIPGKTFEAVSLRPLSYCLLSLCNGRKSIKDIIHQALDPEDRTKKNKRTILDKFRYLQEQGIISAASLPPPSAPTRSWAKNNLGLAPNLLRGLTD